MVKGKYFVARMPLMPFGPKGWFPAREFAQVISIMTRLGQRELPLTIETGATETIITIVIGNRRDYFRFGQF